MATMIETDRLRLRRPRPEDFAASYAMWSDPRVTEHIGRRAVDAATGVAPAPRRDRALDGHAVRAAHR